MNSSSHSEIERADVGKAGPDGNSSLQEVEVARNLEEALPERELYYRTLIENAPEAIVVFDVDKGAFVDANRSAEDLFRMPAEKLFACNPWELSPDAQPDGRNSAAAAREYIQRALQGQTVNFEWVHRDSTGNHIPCEVSLCVIPLPRRRLVRGSIVNMLERKRAEKALRDSDARYRSLFESATFGLYRVGLEGQLLDVNSAVVSMLGYNSADELMAIGRSSNLYVHPSERERLLLELQREGKADALVDWKRKDGKVITVRLVGPFWEGREDRR